MDDKGWRLNMLQSVLFHESNSMCVWEISTERFGSWRSKGMEAPSADSIWLLPKGRDRKFNCPFKQRLAILYPILCQSNSSYIAYRKLSRCIRFYPNKVAVGNKENVCCLQCQEKTLIRLLKPGSASPVCKIEMVDATVVTGSSCAFFPIARSSTIDQPVLKPMQVGFALKWWFPQ